MNQQRPAVPRSLSQAVSELIALRGWGQIQGQACLADAWKSITDGPTAAATRVLGIRRGVLQIAVGNSPLFSELAAYRKPALLAALSQRYPELQIRDLKFFIKGSLSVAQQPQ
jgi:predicted nucleic acid-binding Zn ribbon protein